MRVPKELLLAGTLLLYSGCSSKNEKQLEKSFEKNVLTSGVNMQKTEKIELTREKEVKVMVTASYLNPEESLVDEKWSVPEKFIIGLYYINQPTGGVQLINEDQNLTIGLKYGDEEDLTKAQKAQVALGDVRPPLYIKHLAPGDPLLKNIPIVNNWNSYYYVEFPHSPKENFSLTYQNKTYGTKSEPDGKISYEKYQLDFTKRAKYITNAPKLF